MRVRARVQPRGATAMIDAPHYRPKFAIAIAIGDPRNAGTPVLQKLPGDAAVEISYQANCEIPRAPGRSDCISRSPASRCLGSRRALRLLLLLIRRHILIYDEKIFRIFAKEYRPLI